MSTLFSSSPLIIRCPVSLPRRSRPPLSLTKPMAASQNDSSTPSEKTTKLVTFLGKGGSGKTTSAVLAAQHYAMAGLNTCLVIHTQDPTAEFLLDCKIGSSPVLCNQNLSALRFETTKMLLEPLSRLKQADVRLNMTQGVLEKIVGEELGVLPGMDSIFSAYALEKLVQYFRNVSVKNHGKDRFDVIIYDGISSEEILRMISAASRARLYLKYLRSMAEKTDLGRLAGPSLLRFVDEALDISKIPSLNSQISSEIWDALESMLERGSSAFTELQKFGCFLVMNPNDQISVNCALRYWGCAIQAGSQISGAVGVASQPLNTDSRERITESFSPLPLAFAPHFSFDSAPDWDAILLNKESVDVRNLLYGPASRRSLIPPVEFDLAKKNVTLLLPGFDKKEIKLYQYRGGSELLVEAGDQRRVIQLPSEIQGKVGGAKFIHRSLIITML